jgi:hypothetical protein
LTLAATPHLTPAATTQAAGGFGIAIPFVRIVGATKVYVGAETGNVSLAFDSIDLEIERALADFARAPNGGLIVTPAAGQSPNRDLILEIAAKLKLPAVYADREVE